MFSINHERRYQRLRWFPGLLVQSNARMVIHLRNGFQVWAHPMSKFFWITKNVLCSRFHPIA